MMERRFINLIEDLCFKVPHKEEKRLLFFYPKSGEQQLQPAVDFTR